MVAHPQQSDGRRTPAVCDVCAVTAALRCEACRLDLCVACSRARHRSSLHLTTGRFCFYRASGNDPNEQEDPAQAPLSPPSTASAPNSPAADELRRSLHATSGNNEIWTLDDALTQSLRALTLPLDEQRALPASKMSAESEKRPRSFSDYATLGDPERWRGQSELGELWKAMRTDLASRHVIVRCGTGAWDTMDVRRILDCLNNFGDVVNTRCELTTGGLLFCTFFELSSAVAAVDRWRTDVDLVCFSLPYELPDDVNSATLLVRTRSLLSTSELHQVCSCFGQVASILQPDGQIAKYLVEYNDSRALPIALNGLPHAFHASGPVSVARTAPPTLDMSKLKLYQDCLSRDSRVRPKSFSSSSASLLTSPTSSVASSLNTSFLDGAGSNSPMAAATSATYPGELTSPVLMPQEQQIWARPAPRARSNSSSAYLSGSLSSSCFGESVYSNGFTIPTSSNLGALSSRSNAYSSFQGHPQIHSSSKQRAVSSMEQQYYYGDYRGRQHLPTKLTANRSSYSNPGHFVRSSDIFNGGGRPMTGRHDQGTGEFSLAIDKVASGQDKRTTLMIRNIPNKYTQQMLLAEINRNHRENYDFFYLPIDFKNKCNMGYAFINFIEARHIEAFHKEFDGQKWTNFNSEKVCAISYARLQGKQAMIARFQNSSLLDKHESYRPLVFCSSGPNRGKPETFPAPKQIGHKKQSMHSHSPRIVGAEDYLKYAAHRPFTQQPSQQRHSIAIYPQQVLGMPQHAMPPLATPSGLHSGMQPLPLQYIPPYHQNNPQLASPFLYGVAGMPSNALDYSH